MASNLKAAKGTNGISKGINSVRFSSDGGDSKDKIPEGATILSTEHTVNVEEIENGFIIVKNTNTKYQVKGKEYSDWAYNTKKWYSKDNPLTIETEDKELADLFDE